MNEDAAFLVRVPLHVTGLWLPFWRREPLLAGSVGAGLLIAPPATARVRPCSSRPRFCGVRVKTPGGVVVSGVSVIDELMLIEPSLSMKVSVEVDLPVPLGVGYAASAAVALSAAIGLGLIEGYTLEEAARLAHIAEVRAGTGLGDVVAMLYGRGLVLRYSPGGPGEARVESIPVARRLLVVSRGGPLSTREMHRRLSWRLHSMAAPRLARLLEKPSLERFLAEARGFSVEAGFVSSSEAKVLDEMVEVGLAEGWYAKKRVIVLVSPKPEELRLKLKGRLEGDVRVCETSTEPLSVKG
ncbi:MAG: hypothetical protein DSY37_00440 [Hyperthermus sp.]|nr:MAG: hypothetical protein DSY37_00440 [Hyperthermus sp.]